MKLDQVDEAVDTLSLANFYTIMFRKHIHVFTAVIVAHVCRGVRNVSLLENFVYVVNGWSQVNFLKLVRFRNKHNKNQAFAQYIIKIKHLLKGCFSVVIYTIKQQKFLRGVWRIVFFYKIYPLRKKFPYSELLWSAFFPYFPAFGLNKERSFVSLRIQSECGKMREKCGPE